MNGRVRKKETQKTKRKSVSAEIGGGDGGRDRINDPLFRTDRWRLCDAARGDTIGILFYRRLAYRARTAAAAV